MQGKCGDKIVLHSNWMGISQWQSQFVKMMMKSGWNCCDGKHGMEQDSKYKSVVGRYNCIWEGSSLKEDISRGISQARHFCGSGIAAANIASRWFRGRGAVSIRIVTMAQYVN